MQKIEALGNSRSPASPEETYAVVSVAMEAAFLRARAENPGLSQNDLLVSLLLLKDRLLEKYIETDSLAPPLAGLAKRLYEI